MLFDSASRLAEIYFQKPPIERLALMRDYVTMAREGNTKMREILSNSYLMDKRNDYGNPYKGKRGRSFGSLAMECEEWCRCCPSSDNLGHESCLKDGGSGPIWD